MNAVLYIEDSYVTSWNQLCDILPSKLSPGTTIYDELLTSFLDGMLENWLEEEDGKCKEIANEVKNIDKKQSNSIIIKQLIDIFSKYIDKKKYPDKKIAVSPPEFKRYLSLEKIKCNLRTTDIDNFEEFSIDSDYRDNVVFEFPFSINEVENESFTCEIYDGESVLSTFDINLRDLRIGTKVFSSRIKFSEAKKHDLMLVSNGSQIFRTSINLIDSKKTKDSGDESKIILEYETIEVNGVRFKMIHVKGGTFMMGSTSDPKVDTWSDEFPIHRVTLSSFSISEMQVTQELWNAVMKYNVSEFKGDKLPVENVSWEDCQEFIRKLNDETKRNFRLPTEAEWEYAARGGNKSQGYKYAGSDNLNEVAWYGGNSAKKTHEVGKKKPNELGLYDMSGNVWECCNDWYDNYSSSSQNNPQGPSSGSLRVCRGGSWGSNERRCRVSRRGSITPDNRSSVLGLRLAL